jgi:hypothetical protein
MAAVLTVLVKPPADGTSWAASDSVAVTQPIGAANDKFFSHGQYSDDGLNWNYAPTGYKQYTDSRLTLYGNGFYYDGRYISTDGESWNIGGTTVGSKIPNSLAFDGSHFYVCSASGGYAAQIFKTADGLAVETLYPLSGLGDASEQSYLRFSYGAKFFGVVRSSTDNLALIVTSSDAVSWSTALTTTVPAYPQNPFLCYESTVAESYLIVFDGNTYYTSQDATTWTKRTLPTSADWSGLVFGNGLFMLLAGSGKTVLTSPDGLNWTVLNTLPKSAEWDSIAFAAGKFVVHQQYTASTKTIAISG